MKRYRRVRNTAIGIYVVIAALILASSVYMRVLNPYVATGPGSGESVRVSWLWGPKGFMTSIAYLLCFSIIYGIIAAMFVAAAYPKLKD